MISPINSRKVYVFSDSGESFITENCGATYKKFKHEPTLTSIQPNPVDPRSLIGLVPIVCKREDIECSSSTSDLYLTFDDGVTWRKIATNVD